MRPNLYTPYTKQIDQIRVIFLPGKKKEPPTFRSGVVFALPIFPGSHPPSIVGVHELNFCVRGWGAMGAPPVADTAT